MSHRSYDLNLVSKRLILAGDTSSRSWPNIGDLYGTIFDTNRVKNDFKKTLLISSGLLSTKIL